MDNYTESIECLQKCYNHPCLIHRVHVRAILDAPSLKDGHGKELCRLLDITNQHLQALKAMKFESSGLFIASLLELKLDQGTMFEWQRHIQDSKEVTRYANLLEFLDLRAQALENTTREVDQKHQAFPLDSS